MFPKTLLLRFDGIEEALDFYPPITTVRYDIDATISRTFRIMRNLLQGKEIDEPLEIVSRLSMVPLVAAKATSRIP